MGSAIEESTRDGYVELDNLIRYLVERSGKSASRVSREIGRTSGYLGSVIHRRTIPSAGVLADIAAACGYALVLVGEGEALTVQPVNVSLANDAAPYLGDVIEGTGRNEVQVIGDHVLDPSESDASPFGSMRVETF